MSDEGSGIERRRDQRLATDVPGVLSWDGVNYPARVKDISRGGAAVSVDVSPPNIDTPVHLVVGDESTAFRLAFPATVVMVRRAQSDAGQYAVHLKFDDLQLGDLKPLAQFMSELLAPPQP